MVHCHITSLWGRWSSGKTQDSGLRVPGFESRLDSQFFSEQKIRQKFAPLHPGV